MRKFLLVGAATTALLLAGSNIAVFAEGNNIKVTGEVIDTFCYATMGAHGEGHRQCGLACAKKGIPVGILANGTGKIYVLLPNKNGTSLPDAVIDKMGRIATITGNAYSKGGDQFLTVKSVS